MDSVDNMNNDAVLQIFDEIEHRVEKLLERCKALEAENSQLIEEIERLESELKAKTEAEKSFAEERTKVRSKIDSLFARLEHIS